MTEGVDDAITRRRAADARRQAERRRRERFGLDVLRIEVDSEITDHLIELGFLHHDRAGDRKAVERAASQLVRRAVENKVTV